MTPRVTPEPHPDCDEADWDTAASWGVTAGLVGLFGGGFVATYGVDRFFEYAAMLGEYGALLQFAVMAALLVVHGTVHAVAFVVLGSLSLDEVALDVEVRPEGSYDPVAASVRPTAAIDRRAYRFGLAAPGVALGVLPGVVGLATGNPLAAWVGVVGLLAATPDVHGLITTWRRADSTAGTPAST